MVDEGNDPAARTILEASYHPIPLPNGNFGYISLYIETTMATSVWHRSLELIFAALTTFEATSTAEAGTALIAQRKYLPAIEACPTLEQILQDLLHIGFEEGSLLRNSAPEPAVSRDKR